MQKRRYDPQRAILIDTSLMASDAIFIDVVTNPLQLVGYQKMGFSIQQLNGIHKLKSYFTIVL